MTYQVIWDEHAIDAATRFLKDDSKGLQHLLDAVDLLGDDPRPAGTAEYGSRDLRRMHVGRYRVLYEITTEHRHHPCWSLGLMLTSGGLSAGW